jgi:hypothetical protein
VPLYRSYIQVLGEDPNGPVAPTEEQHHGMVKVVGSTPIRSTWYIQEKRNGNTSGNGWPTVGFEDCNFSEGFV